MTPVVRWLVRTALCGGALSCFPILVHFRYSPVRWHQFDLAMVDLRYGHPSLDSIENVVIETWLSGCQLLRNEVKDTPQIDDPVALANYLFDLLPSRCIVTPTEGFFYFRLMAGDMEIWGNFRIADIHEGKISFAYFTVPDKHVWTLLLDQSKGLEIERIEEGTYSATFLGNRRLFVLPRKSGTPTGLRLHADEEFVGTVHDESGMRLSLLFNWRERSFYEVLDESTCVPDTLELLTENLLIGKRTKFVFLDDPAWRRRLLVGVALDAVERNDYFDGPGDQVPFSLDLQDKLYLAYPQTLLGDGIDRHGVYRNTEHWRRIAISPYLRYSSPSELQARYESCRGLVDDRSAYWTAMTKEWWNTEEWVSRTLEKVRGEGKEASLLAVRDRHPTR